MLCWGVRGGRGGEGEKWGSEVGSMRKESDLSNAIRFTKCPWSFK